MYKQSNLDGQRVIKTRRVLAGREPIRHNENCTSPVVTIQIIKKIEAIQSVERIL